eukprot:Skav227947  [mRNA]  locus=scaffold146:562796:564164:- [translate_table: standard]
MSAGDACVARDSAKRKDLLLRRLTAACRSFSEFAPRPAALPAGVLALTGDGAAFGSKARPLAPSALLPSLLTSLHGTTGLADFACAVPAGRDCFGDFGGSVPLAPSQDRARS